MINLIHAEFYKLRRSLAFKLSFLATIVCAVLLTVMSNGVSMGTMEVTANTASGLCDIFIISVLGSLLAGSIMCSDFENKNIHDAISCGRKAIIISKAVVYCIAISLLVLPYAIVGLGGFLAQGSYAKEFNFSTYTMLMSNAAGLTMTANHIGKAVFLVLVSFILYAARLSICIPLAFKVRKPVVVTVVGVLFSFVVDLIQDTLSKIPVIGNVIEFLPYNKVALTMDMSTGELIQTLICSIIFIIIMSGITYAGFKKSEIK